jgi:transposase-like protein
MPLRSAFAGFRFRFPAGVIPVAMGWYLRVGLSYQDVEALLAANAVSTTT